MNEKLNNLKALVIENDPYILKALVKEYRRFVGHVDTADTLEDAISKLRKEKYQVLSIDLNLTDGGSIHRDGLKILPYAKEQGALSFILSAYEDKETVFAAAKDYGDINYIKKRSLLFGGVKGLNQQVFNEEVAKKIIIEFANPLPDLFGKKVILSEGKLKNDIYSTFEGSLADDDNTLLLGETGVGKTTWAKLLAKGYHAIDCMLANEDLPFIYEEVNLKSVNPDQIEKTLFGAKAGAYTDQKGAVEGLFSKVNGGVLFLDEIGAAPKEFQEKLLKALDRQEDGYFYFTPMDEKNPQKTKFKLITGTCQDLGTLYQKGELREDFYFRIESSIPLVISPLRERRDDINPLVDFFVDKSSRAIILSPEVRKHLNDYDWFGNTRQLERLIKELVSLKKTLIEKNHLPPYIIKNEHPLLEADDYDKILTKKLEKFIIKHKMPKLIKILEELAFESIFEQTGGQITTTGEILGFGRKKTYAIKNRIEESKRDHYVQ